MVGLVIVSHSARLAEGVAELARGMAGPDVQLAATGGLDLPDRPLGTDAGLVLQAIEGVYSDDGVLVLMDLGSAVLSAEMALETLLPDRRSRVLLCEAPLVEGALAAAVQARLGRPLEQVAAEARGALAAKTVHLTPPHPPSPARLPRSPDRKEQPGEGEQGVRLTVRNYLGLHARPAARFVQTAGRFPQANVRVTNLTAGRGPVSARSINAVTTLGVRQGHEIEILATGPQAQAALAALRALADENFGDVEEKEEGRKEEGRRKEEAVAPSSFFLLPPSFQGIPASPGIAIGPARLFRPLLPRVPAHSVAEPQSEWDRLAAALEKTHGYIRATRAGLAGRADNYTVALFDAHLLFLDDDALREPARRAIFDDCLNAAAAWQRAIESVAADYRALDDDYLRARAADVEDVGSQVLFTLLDSAAPAPTLAASGILVAGDLTPADTAALDPTLVRGICTAHGGPTSHSAILARALGIPAVVGVGQRALALAEGTPLILDGATGQVWPDPAPDLLAEYIGRAEAERAAGAAALAASAAPAVTRDGRRIEVAANIGSAADARAAVAAGAEAVGLFRTEFLFLDRRTAPDEDEQYAAYRAVAEILDRRPLIIRTLDVGGDKPLPYLDMGAEANPFLGWRAIRPCLARPDFFKVQLRAILRTAAEFPLRVMFPMVAILGEFRAARALLAEARAEVAGRGQAVPERVETGIMVEIPAAALRADQFAREVDFFSIGTNDLTQYTLAAERGNPRVAALADAFQPAVLELIRQVAQAAQTHGKWAGVCGELAGDPLAAPLLIGLGITELSMSPPAIPRVKQTIHELDYAAACERARAALSLETAQAVRASLG
ncbi:MAG: phosphoenolpyruvate--protein phosphotransferase [Chloroflexi bacterium]|nr:phosphoenolpyruvate--protein phosphotransferase [Chloroflexota bacterium]